MLTVSGLLVVGVGIAATAIAGSGDVNTKSEHWGAIPRNTIGSPVAELRDGPAVAVLPSGDVSAPPYGKGSLGIAVADRSTSRNANNTKNTNPLENGSQPEEKAAFGNEVDFFGEPVLGIEETGFHVFQTGENVTYGGVSNLPNITFEIDPNMTAPGTDDFTSMVFVPTGAGVPVNVWSDYIDATDLANGRWYFTGGEGTATGCPQTDPTPCSLADAQAGLSDGGAEPTIRTAAIGKGRDNMWIGAVDGFRFNGKIYDFEGEPKGVKEKSAK